MTALDSTPADDGRVMVLLMDDIGVPAAGTSPMQQIASVVLAPMGNGDELSVVRLSSRSDEAFGDFNIFAHENNFVAAGEAIWQEAGHYHLLGYWPAASERDLRSIDVVYVLGFQAKYTGTPSSTIASPGHVVAGRYTNSASRMVAAPTM